MRINVIDFGLDRQHILRKCDYFIRHVNILCENVISSFDRQHFIQGWTPRGGRPGNSKLEAAKFQWKLLCKKVILEWFSFNPEGGPMRALKRIKNRIN